VTAFVPPAAIPADTINDPHIDSAWGLAFDGAGNVWVANGNSGTVTAYAPGTSTEIAADTITGLHGPFSLTFAP
jgi:hypothetical protein